MSVLTEPVTERVVTDADVLVRAADLLEEFGWCQEDFGSKASGGFCMWGAVMEAAHDLNRLLLEFDAWRIASDALGGLERVADWNDASGRTKAEVVAKLREAARACEPVSVEGHEVG